MTAMSAQSTSQTPSNVARTVLLPGSPATYANRAFLKGLGLRWDPEGHRWHGTASAENVRVLREQLGLEVRCFGSLEIEATLKEPTSPKPVAPNPRPTLEVAQRPHDGSRTNLEARLAFPAEGSEEELSTPTRRFTLDEITSGLPDDSREEDERADARYVRDLRGRVKAARAVVSRTPGLVEKLTSDWKKAARFWARFGITEEMFRAGVKVSEPKRAGILNRLAFTEWDRLPWGALLD